MLNRITICTYIYLFLAIVMISFGSCTNDKTEPVYDNTTDSTVTDIDGNIYRIVRIGSQVWMAENLKVTRFRNGDAIVGYCDYNNDSSNGIIYGHLYYGGAIEDLRDIAPLGWHVPTHADWETLSNYLGGSLVAGGKMKETDTVYWASPNVGATNECGFNALPGGFWGTFYLNMGQEGEWWTSEPFTDVGGWSSYIYSNSATLYIEHSSPEDALSIRCIKDK